MQFIKRQLKNKYMSLLGINFVPRTFQEALVRLQTTTPFLLVGLPRSGTSITQSWINQHPQAFISYESIIEPYIKERNPYRLAGFFYESLRQYSHLNNMSENSVVKSTIQSGNYKLVGNKTIFQLNKSYQRSLVSAIKNQQKLKVIFIDRDPRDRIASIIKWHKKRDATLVNTKTTSENVSNIIQTEASRSNDFTDFVSKMSCNDNVLVINYEKIATKQLDVNALYSFLGLDACDPVKSFFDDEMRASSIDKWRQDLTAKQLEQIEAICDCVD
ncbi:sulfotransferase domain-containing protein [Paraglaciecola sp.]|uniref:sulfotransferase domain-containing protein n=1 Tax=Paraglaciecola sp. TaxID=1920173 RepID=UPI003EF81AAE